MGGPIRSISAVTLHVADMVRSLAFYTALGFEPAHGEPGAAFASLRIGEQFLNLMLVRGYEAAPTWGRVIFHVDDVDAMHARAVGAGLKPQFDPRDAGWGERYFHITDPDGHELSFAKRLR